MFRRILLIVGSLIGLLVVVAGVAYPLRHELLRRYEDLPALLIPAERFVKLTSKCATA